MGAIGVLARKQKTQKGYIKRTFQREGLKEGCKLKYHHQYNFRIQLNFFRLSIS